VSKQTVAVRIDLPVVIARRVRAEHRAHACACATWGIVNSHSQTLMGEALVSGTVGIGTDPYSFERAEDAHLQQVKNGCLVISHPHGNTDLDC
jgi:hypothetical protein